MAAAVERGASGTAGDDASGGVDAGRWERARQSMVDRQIVARGLDDARVVAALRRVPRERFVPAAERDSAYADRPLPIGYEQTISQPYIVALMTACLELQGDEAVLEIGTGSGYQAAVLGALVRVVHTVEIVPDLAERAAATLADAGYANVHVHGGDGTWGWPASAPYDAILVTAAPERVPEALLQQLRPGGRLVLPVGPADNQRLVRLVRGAQGDERQEIAPVRFVPMTGGGDRLEERT